MFKKERVVPRPPLPSQDHPPRPSTQQFNAAPRFTFSSTPRPNPSQVLPRSTPAASRYLTPGAKTTQRDLDVIDVSSDGDPEDLLQSIETGQENVDIDPKVEDDGNEEHQPKRRRLSNSVEVEDHEDLGLVKHERDEDQYMEEDLLSSLPILSSPPAPHRKPISTTTPRFYIPIPAPLSTPGLETTASNTPAFLKPPKFRPPDPAEAAEAQVDPLPDQFSPHRKGQKYIPGGLASEMRDLLMNIENTTSAKGTGNKRRDHDWQVKLVIDEISGSERSGLTLVRGRQLHNMDGDVKIADTIGFVKIALAGEGAGTGLQKGARAEAGRHLGIKGPMWEILLDGVKWGVGVDWKIL